MATEGGRVVHPRNPELLALAKGAGEGARRAATFAAKTALQTHPVPDHPAPQALDALERDDLPAALRFRDDLDVLAAALDGAYLDLSAAAGPETDMDVLDAFARARAVDALVAALAPDAVDAAMDAIYEAQASLLDNGVEGFLESAKALLRQLQRT